MTALLVVNPAAGKTDPGKVDEIREALSVAGNVVTLRASEHRDQDLELRAAAPSADLVVVAGGDGTISGVVNALRDTVDDLRLGIIPSGTGNDLARTLGLPSDPLEAARVAVEGRDRAIDVGRASGGGVDRLFVNACIGGIAVEVDAAIDASHKEKLGRFAFWLGGLKAAVDLQPFAATLDGATLEHCLAVGVGNGRTCGGGFEVWPDAELDDGLLDGCALAAEGPLDALRLAVTVKGGSHVELERVATARGRAIELITEPPVEVNVDGELVGLRTPATFEVGARLTVRAPR